MNCLLEAENLIFLLSLLRNHILKYQKRTRELQQIALNHSSDMNIKDFMNIYKKYTTEPYSLLVNDTTLPSDDPLRFRKNLLG